MGTAVGLAMDDAGDAPGADVPASAKTPEAVVRFLAGHLADSGQIPQDAVESVVARVMRRESLGSTGVGGGLALPHAAADDVAEVVHVVGRLATPVNWGAIDGKPVQLVALVVAPKAKSVAALEALLRRLRGHGAS